MYKILKDHKQIWIKKARGIGVTTFLLYWILYKSLTEWSHNDNDRVLVVTGPRQELAEDFVSRYKNLFREKFPGIYSQLLKQSKTSATVNGVKLEAFPSHHVDSMRGYVNVRAIVVDEADYFPPGQQQQVSAVLAGYLAKPDASPTIILCSTPASPMGLMQQIELDQHSPYYKMSLPYQYGLEGPHPIYDLSQLELARRSASFPREYECQYIGLSGNLISEQAIQNCIKLGEELDSIPIKPHTNKVLGIDSAFGGGSNFGIVGLEYISDIGRYRVILAEEYHRPHLKDMIDHVWDLKNRYGGIKHIYCDASSPVTWQSLKQSFGEQWSESYIKSTFEDCSKYNIPIERRMFIIPLAFSKLHKELLSNMKHFTELTDAEGKSYIGIHPQRYDKLITALRTAYATEYSLDKVATSFSDILDSFRMCAYYIKRK